MATTLGISFSSTCCDAVLLGETKGRILCLAKKTFDVEFSNKNQALKIKNELKPLCQKKSRVIIGIPMTHAMTQQLTVDRNLSTKEIRVFLKTQITPLFGQNEKDVCWDYETSTVDDTHQEITLVATQKTLINHLQQLFLTSKQPISAIEPDVFSFVRVITKYSPEKIFYALIAKENGFLFLSGKQGKLKQYELITLPVDSHQLSLILSTVAPKNCIILISLQGQHAFQNINGLFEKHNLVTDFVPIEKLLRIHNTENNERYFAAIALCSWRM